MTAEEPFSVPSDLSLITDSELRELEARGMAYAARLLEDLDRIRLQLGRREDDALRDAELHAELHRNRAADQLAMNRDPEAWARLGRSIRRDREAYGWTRAQLARAADVSTGAIQLAERGRVPRSRWPQTVASVEKSLGWAPGTARAIIKGETPQAPPFPLEIKLMEQALRYSCFAEITDGDVAAEAGISINDWWQLIRRTYPPVRASAKTLAHIAYALHITESELESVGRADAAEELRALDSFRLRTLAPQLSERDPRFEALLAITGTMTEEELRDALRYLGWKVPHDRIFSHASDAVIEDLVKHDRDRPE